MKQLNETASQLIYSDYDSFFNELLEKDGSFTVHHCSIQTFAIEMFKVCNNLSETIFSHLFYRQENTCNFGRNGI